MNNPPPSKIKFNCDFCGQVTHQKRAQYKRKKNHFCSTECYAKFMKNKKMPPLIVKELKPITIEEFKKQYTDIPEEWVHPADFDKPYIYVDPFEMFNKGKEK